ncbi:ATP-binding protein [Actinoallomurus soli]|uniref:ATP-binding protein n=1 Tax=Actinoallomurus soli TaxID=2952535 RepID=UPI00209239D7|nr:ATP-binding protein [Actinoallomurus soli]MCO5974809.1 ATP-binding protein [Actinoallomurus soli]
MRLLKDAMNSSSETPSATNTVATASSGSNAYSTGGGGVTFAHRVAVIYLASMLTGSRRTETNELAVRSLAFQTGPAHPVDDLLVVAGDREVELAIACRATPHFVPSHTTTVKLVKSLLDEVAAHPNGQVAVAVAGWKTEWEQVAKLCDIARTNANANAFHTALETEGRWSQGVRGRYTQLRQMVSDALDGTATHAEVLEVTWALLTRLRILGFKLQSPDETDWTGVATSLDGIAAAPTDGVGLRDRLAVNAGRYDAMGAVVDLNLLRKDTHPLLNASSTRAKQAWDILNLKPRQRSVLTHEEILQGLRSRHTFLLDNELPFAGPGADHEADPARLLARLSAADPPGVLIIGPAGAGKTRTCLEVAAIAHAQGWRVLHVLASPEVTVEHLSADLLESGHGRILLIFDHLDGYSQLDLRALADEFLADAKRSEIDVALLASTRPGSENELMHRGGAEFLFEPVHLRNDQAYRSQVAGHIIHTVAPASVQNLGETAMAEACGQRPIIALLIAQAIERCLTDGHPVPEVVNSHAGKLRPWLRDALQHDQLTGTVRTPPGPLSMAAPSAQELACAVAVAACPQPREDIEAVVDNLPGDNFGVLAVEHLLRLGWLEEVNGQLVTVHDIVTDELVLHSMLPPPSYGIHEPSAEAVFAALSRDIRSLALLAAHLRRIMADLSAQTKRHQAAVLKRFCEQWLVQHRARLGELLATAGKDGEHVLLTMLLDRPWCWTVAEWWEELGARWLAWAESRKEATSFLAAVIRAKHAPAVIVNAALSWLSRNYLQTDAHRVILALLGRTKLTAVQRRFVLNRAMAWVEKQPRWAATPEVLYRLLADAATRTERIEAARCALTWLRRDLHPQAQIFRVVRLLLTLEDVPGEFRNSTVITALSWVETHEQDGAPVLSALLRARTLTESQRHQVGEISLRWLREHPPEPSRRPLIHALLDSDQDREKCLSILWSQIRENEADPVVIYRMLEDGRINAEQARFVIDQAFGWLQSANHLADIRLVITALMRRDDLTAEESARLTNAAMVLVDTGSDPKFLTVMLRRCSSLNAEQVRRLVTAAVEQCRSRRGLKRKRPLINALLLRRDLAPDEVREAIGLAFRHLDADSALDRGAILISLLERLDLLPDESERAISHALRWLDQDQASSSIHFPHLLTRLLRRTDLPPPAVASCERHAREWLATVPPEDERAEDTRRNFPYQADN